jgi:hypothetical protein
MPAWTSHLVLEQTDRQTVADSLHCPFTCLLLYRLHIVTFCLITASVYNLDTYKMTYICTKCDCTVPENSSSINSEQKWKRLYPMTWMCDTVRKGDTLRLADRMGPKLWKFQTGGSVKEFRSPTNVIYSFTTAVESAWLSIDSGLRTGGPGFNSRQGR